MISRIPLKKTPIKPVKAQETKKKSNNKPKKRIELKLKVDLRKLFSWLLIFLMIGFLMTSFMGPLPGDKKKLPEVLNDIKAEKVEKIDVEGEQLSIKYKNDDKTYESRKEGSETFVEVLEKSGIEPSTVNFEIKDQSMTKAWGNILELLLPVVLTGLIILFIFKQMRGAQDSIFSFGKSKAKLFAKGKQDIRFDDVGGVDEAKKELEEIVDFLRHPQKYRKLGARTPKGVLLVGLSGTGKTLLARAVAGEAAVPYFSMAGSEFMEMLVGVGASVTGDTPILVKDSKRTQLVEIGKFVDQFYKKNQSGFVVSVDNVKTLGMEPEKNGFWGTRSNKRPIFGGSTWQDVKQVYRHKVNEIYIIEYLGGKLKTTGDHSLFVREQGGIRAKEVRKLKKGDVLVNLPMNTRAWNPKKKKTIHTIKQHKFSNKMPKIWLDVWQDDPIEISKHQFVFAQKGIMSQCAIAEHIGVSQATVGHWQRGIYGPQKLSKKAVKLELPDKILVTPALCKLFGYYTAEGRGTGNLEFTFGIHEKVYVEEVARLMDQVFGLAKPVLERTETSAIRIKYFSAHLGRFFAKYCGNGSHNKRMPGFLWDLPKNYFLAFLSGYANGDGYTTKAGKLSCSSVSHQLIRELAWLSSMHGIKIGIKHEVQKAGRKINRKPLPATEFWTLIIGKTSHPFIEKAKYPYQFKRCIVRSVKKQPFSGYVYDLCGVNNEAFFGGEKPILLHNSRVRDLFSTAKKASPSIIFIDEIDAIGRMRGLGVAGGHDEREQTLNQILVEMDGFAPNDHVIVIAATNRGDLLDPALMRPGRFDRRVTLDLPDIEGRKKIIGIHSKGKPFAKNVSWDRVARRTVGFSGADLENMANEAAIQAARHNKSEIDMDDLEEAATRVKLGPEKRRLQSKRERLMTAYHEAGHAIAAHLQPNMDQVHRVSIVSRGLALGYTLIPPERDRYQETKSELLEQAVALLGGRAAEELEFNELTGGAASDIDKVTTLARKMVIDYGMSALGPIHLGPQIETSDWGKAYVQPSELSEELRAKVDREVKSIVDEAYKKALALLKKNKPVLDKVAHKLVEIETLEGEEFEKLIGIKKARSEDTIPNNTSDQ